MKALRHCLPARSLVGERGYDKQRRLYRRIDRRVFTADASAGHKSEQHECPVIRRQRRQRSRLASLANQ